MKEQLKALITQLELEGLSSFPNDSELVTTQTGRNARQFIDLISDKYELPKVAPDGEGGLVFGWEKDDTASVVVGFTNKAIFAVQAPGTSNSKYFDEVSYCGTIPSDILDILSKYCR